MDKKSSVKKIGFDLDRSVAKSLKLLSVLRETNVADLLRAEVTRLLTEAQASGELPSAGK